MIPMKKQDHPRTCGEKLNSLALKCSLKGSPPHMRGKEIVVEFVYRQCRITPAHAGKRPFGFSSMSPCRDHPRTCGEKWLSVLQIRLLLGSPPHMRGKALLQSSLRNGTGITPAHAGKSPPNGLEIRQSGDHPRTCGEKHTYCAFLSNSPGITPAHAGKSIFLLEHLHVQRDHPRTCGEKLLRSSVYGVVPGSPPHMRGKD